jgi:hypothetical protein
MADEVEVRIGLPLPMDVASTIVRAFAILWPDGHFDQKRSPSGSEMVAVISADDRMTRATKKKLAAAKVNSEDVSLEGLLAAWDPDGSLGLTLPQVANERLADICVAMLSTADAPNYLETPVRTPDGHRYAVAACRSVGQTPHALRMKAEKERDAALAEVERLRAELAEVRGG